MFSFEAKDGEYRSSQDTTSSQREVVKVPVGAQSKARISLSMH